MASFDLQQACDEFRADGRVATEIAPVLDRVEELFGRGPASAASGDLAGRARGTLLGVGVGDALGRAVEGRRPPTSIDRYEKWRGWTGGPVGTITDDTQMTIWLGQSLLACDGLDPIDLARRFTVEHIRGIGSAVKQFIVNAKDRGLPWQEADVDSAGNGAAMRAAPVAIYYRTRPRELVLASIIQSFVTHTSGMAVASSIVVAALVALLLEGRAGDLASVDGRIRLCEELAGLIDGFEADQSYRTRKDDQPDTLAHRLRVLVPEALRAGTEPLEFGNRYFSGAYVLESLPLALYCFLRSPKDFRSVLLAAVNSSVDSDTVAAIACAFAGAHLGADAIGPAYLDELEFRAELEGLAASLLD